MTDNKAIYRLLIETWNSGNFERTPEWLAADYTSHNPIGPGGRGREGFMEVVTWFRGVFPDFVFKIEFMVSEGDMLVGHWTGSGTHEGEIMGLPPTGKKITFRGFDTIRVAGGKVVEVWHLEDNLGLINQISDNPLAPAVG